MYLCYLSRREKEIIFSIEGKWKKFLESVQNEFHLDQTISIFEISSGAEINSADVLEPNNDLLIKVQTTQSEVRLVSPIIMLRELIGKKYKKEELYSKANEWAGERHFKLVYREGLKAIKKGWKREMKCNVENCKFKLTFKSDKTGQVFELDEKLSNKHNKHSGKHFINDLKIIFFQLKIDLF